MDSNHHSEFRKLLFYPLNYKGINSTTFTSNRVFAIIITQINHEQCTYLGLNQGPSDYLTITSNETK